MKRKKVGLESGVGNGAEKPGTGPVGAPHNIRFLQKVLKVAPDDPVVHDVIAAYKLLAPLVGCDPEEFKTGDDGAFMKILGEYWKETQSTRALGVSRVQPPPFNASLLRDVFLASLINPDTWKSVDWHRVVSGYPLKCSEDALSDMEGLRGEENTAVLHRFQVGTGEYVVVKMGNDDSFYTEGIALANCLTREDHRLSYLESSLPSRSGWPRHEYFSIRKTWSSALSVERELYLRLIPRVDRVYAMRLLRSVLAKDPALAARVSHWSGEKLVTYCVGNGSLPLLIPVCTIWFDQIDQRIGDVLGFGDCPITPQSVSFPLACEALRYLSRESQTVNAVTGETRPRVVGLPFASSNFLEKREEIEVWGIDGILMTLDEALRAPTQVLTGQVVFERTDDAMHGSLQARAQELAELPLNVLVKSATPRTVRESLVRVGGDLLDYALPL